MTKTEKEKMTMMKKEYIAPAIEVIEMDPVSMIAISNDESIDIYPEEGEELSNRRRNYWSEVGGK